MKIAFKVVQEYIGKYYSPTLTNVTWIEYRIKQDAIPLIKGSPIMAFETLDNAYSFKGQTNWKCFKCEINDIYKNIFHIHPEGAMLTFEEMSNYWNNRLYQKNNLPPAGTIFCGRIKLIEEIK